ncbi:hypothetical protein T484DRAFT_1869980 [Baffinella frigidus]|nr:hypothetical protein T484DRAFT_1869980 [Cryptophyta sp. CCMP2293]
MTPAKNTAYDEPPKSLRIHLLRAVEVALEIEETSPGRSDTRHGTHDSQHLVVHDHELVQRWVKHRGISNILNMERGNFDKAPCDAKTLVSDASNCAERYKNTLPAHRALEFCGVEDEAARLKQHRSTPAHNMLPSGISLVSSPTSSGGSSSAAFPLSASASKAVLEWGAGRERRAMVASNPRRSRTICAYFQEELSNLSKQAAQE